MGVGHRVREGRFLRKEYISVCGLYVIKEPRHCKGCRLVAIKKSKRGTPIAIQECQSMEEALTWSANWSGGKASFAGYLL